MEFLIIEYNIPEQEQLVRSHTVMDEDAPLYILLMECNEDPVQIITKIPSKMADFPRLLDKYCLIRNGGKIISGNSYYSELAYEERETDIGVVKLVTIQVSQKI